MYYVYDKSQKTIINESNNIKLILGFIENTEQMDLSNDLFESNNYIILTEYQNNKGELL